MKQKTHIGQINLYFDGAILSATLTPADIVKERTPASLRVHP